MNIVLKDKIKVDKNFINDLITKSWEDSDCIQNQIDSIEIDSDAAATVVKLLKDLLTSYYILTGCLENLENKPIELVKPIRSIEPEVTVYEKPVVIPKEPIKVNEPNTALAVDTPKIEPFEYFVDFDEPTGEPLTDEDLYN